MKKIAILTLIIVVLGSLYFLTKKTTPTQKSALTPSSQSTPSPTEIGKAWIPYMSDEFGFSIEHPLDVKAEGTQEGIHFLKFGPSQSIGTELFDGMSLLIFSGAFTGKSFEEFVQNEYIKEKNEPTTESISSLKKTTVNSISGYTYIMTSLGTRTIIYLPKGNTMFIKITDSTVQPENVKRDFKEIVNSMLKTLTF